MTADELLKEYEELDKRAHELKGKLHCGCDPETGLCVTPEVKQAKQDLIEVTWRMDEINEELGKEKKLAYHY
jgi:hypothetical protein